MRVFALIAVVVLLVAAGWALNEAIQGAPSTAVKPIVLVDPPLDDIKKTNDDHSRPRGQNRPAGDRPAGDPGGQADPRSGGGGSLGGPGGGGSSGGSGGAAPAPPPPARPAGDDVDDGAGGGATDDGGGDD
jgi:hypothetical protein